MLNLNEINGVSIDKLPLNDLKEIGDIMFPEFPSTVLYEDDSSSLFIWEWIDCDENNKDIQFLYGIDKISLSRFFQKEISHIELIKKNNLGFGFIFYGNIESPFNIKIVDSKNIPNELLPNGNYFLKDEDVIDVDSIIKYLQLDNIESESEQKVYKLTDEIGNNLNSEIINIHLMQGQGVSFGKISSDLLGHSLINFESLYRNIAFDYYKGKQRGNIRNLDEYQSIRSEFISSEAASFICFLKPSNSTSYNLFNDKTNTQEIFELLFKLFNNSEDQVALNNIYNIYSDFVFKAYLQLLEHIQEQDLSIDYMWTTPINKLWLSHKFNRKNSTQVIENIKNIEDEDGDEFELTGYFKELNINSGHFTFLSESEQKYFGYFDNIVFDSMPSMNFLDKYNIKINRKVTKRAGKKDPEIDDKIVSVIKHEE